MALQKGFPPSNLISPSVRISEVDLSFLPAVQTGHKVGIVGFASKGPINSVTRIGSIRELYNTFGYPHPDTGDPYLIYAAEQFLQFGNELFVVRVAQVDLINDEGATTATIDVPTAGGPVQILSNIAGPYTFAEDRFFKWKLNRVLSSKTLVVLAGTYTVTNLVETLNDRLNPAIDGIEFFWTNPDPVTKAATSASKLALRSVFSYGVGSSIELVSVQDSLYGPVWNGTTWVGPVSGLGTGMVAAYLLGTKDRYPLNSSQTAGIFDFSGLSGLNLQIVVDGTDNILIDNVVQVINISGDAHTLQDIVDEINEQVDQGDVPGGFFATLTGNYIKLQTYHSGSDAKLIVKSSSTADTLLGLSNRTVVGTSPSGQTGTANYNAAFVTGNANSGDVVCFTISADSPGIDGNQTQVRIRNNNSDGNFSLEVFSYGNQVEQYGLLVKDPSSRSFVESYLSLVSSFVRVVNNDDTLALPANGIYSLKGGTDGIPSDPDEQDLLLVGNEVAMTGLQALGDPEQVDIDLVAVPGHPSTNNILALLDFCRNKREDCFAIIEPPFGLSVREITQWQNGSHPLNDIRFDNDFGALYWPWVKIRDSFNRLDVWVPPAGVVLGAFARSDSIGAPWLAPAGTTRGVCPTVLDVFTRPNLEERDSMYGNRNCVNPIVNFPDLDAFVIMGNKTLQRRQSALDRVNVRRMMLYIEKRIKARCRDLLFEPNDAISWQRFINIAESECEIVRNGRGITDFRVQCDAELNTPDVVDRNELRAKIGIVPTKAVEFIFIEFSLFRTGAFTESSNF